MTIAIELHKAYRQFVQHGGIAEHWATELLRRTPDTVENQKQFLLIAGFTMQEIEAAYSTGYFKPARNISDGVAHYSFVSWVSRFHDHHLREVRRRIPPPEGKRRYTIWKEGYSATGGSSDASMLGEVVATSFQEACDTLCSSATWQYLNGNYDPKRLTVWGCRLLDNEADARRSFG